MNQVKEIYLRRSIRKYTAEPVSISYIEEIVKAGMNAPSAGDEQPWHFIIIDKKEILEEITSVHPHANMLREAQVALLVCGDLSLEKRKGFWVQDCSAATENMLIAAAGLGLGSVWLGIYPREDRVAGLKRILGLPEQIIPFSLLPLGYPGEEKPPKNIFRSERIRRNKW